MRKIIQLSFFVGCAAALCACSKQGSIVPQIPASDKVSGNTTNAAKLNDNLSDVVVVKQSQLQLYWKQTNRKFSLYLKDEPKPQVKGVVEVGFVIDKLGNTSHFEVLKSAPQGKWDQHGLNAAKQLAFSEVQVNQDTPAIYTTWVFEFSPN